MLYANASLSKFEANYLSTGQLSAIINPFFPIKYQTKFKISSFAKVYIAKLGVLSKKQRIFYHEKVSPIKVAK